MLNLRPFIWCSRTIILLPNGGSPLDQNTGLNDDLRRAPSFTSICAYHCRAVELSIIDLASLNSIDTFGNQLLTNLSITCYHKHDMDTELPRFLQATAPEHISSGIGSQPPRLSKLHRRLRSKAQGRSDSLQQRP